MLKKNFKYIMIMIDNKPGWGAFMIKKQTEKLHSWACEKSNPLKPTQRGMQRNKATAFFEYYEEYKELKCIFFTEKHIRNGKYCHMASNLNIDLTAILQLKNLNTKKKWGAFLIWTRENTAGPTNEESSK